MKFISVMIQKARSNTRYLQIVLNMVDAEGRRHKVFFGASYAGLLGYLQNSNGSLYITCLPMKSKDGKLIHTINGEMVDAVGDTNAKKV